MGLLRAYTHVNPPLRVMVVELRHDAFRCDNFTEIELRLSIRQHNQHFFDKQCITSKEIQNL